MRSPGPGDDPDATLDGGAFPSGPSQLLRPREVHLSEYWKVVLKHRTLVTLAVGLGLAGALLMSFLSTPLYRATATLNVEKDKGSPLDIAGMTVAWDWYSPEFIPTQTRLMRSREVARRAAVWLNLTDHPELSPKVSGLARQVAGEKPAGDRKAKAQDPVDRVASLVLAGLETSPVRGTNLVELSYVSTSPQLAADVANAVADAYIDWGIESKFKAVGQASQFLGKQIEQLKGEVDEKERQLQAYGQSKDIVSVDPQQNVTLQKLEALNKDYAAAVTDRIAREARYYEITTAPAEAIADTLSNGLVTQLRNELLKLERQYAEKLNVYKPEWPAMVELRTQVAKGKEHLDAVVKETVEKARETAKAEYLTAQRREESLKQVLKGQKAEAMTLNRNAVEYNNLKVEVAAKRSLLDTLTKRQNEMEVMSRLKGSRESSIRVVDPAQAPSGPFRPSYRRNGLLGLFLGLVGGLGLAFFLEYLDRSIRTREQVEQQLQLPALGLIPAVGAAAGRRYGGYGYGYGYGEAPPPRSALRRFRSLARLGRSASPGPGQPRLEDKERIELLPHHQMRSVVAEAYRSFRTALLLASAGGWKSLVVTSTVPGEGKTATVVNLAVVLGQLGRKVVVVDSDLHKPRIQEALKVPNRVGLVSVLAEGVELGKALQQTQVPNVWALTSGPLSPNPSGLLASERMRHLLGELEEGFDHVLLDSPPVQPVADALILGHFADGAVLCVKGGVTARDLVERTRDELYRAGIRIFGVLLNNLADRAGSYGPNYYRYREEDGDVSPQAPSQAAGA